MLADYKMQFPNKESWVGHTSFRSMEKAITQKDMKAKTAVDYVSGTLLYDNLEFILNG